jgi:hypothetical protein
VQPDNYIQTPEDYLGCDRYTYCRGNPLKYTDPSGELALIENEVDAWKLWHKANEIMKYMRAAMDQADNEHNLLSNHIDNLAALAEEALSQPSFRGSGKYSNEGTNDENDSDNAEGNVDAGANGGNTTTNDNAGLNVDGVEDENEPYEQLPLPTDKNGNYVVLDNATVANTSNAHTDSNDPVVTYYKPEKGEASFGHRVNPGFYITGAVDGISTGFRENEVFKVPDGTNVVVWNGGYVTFRPNAWLTLAEIRTGFGYKFGWLNSSQLPGNWDTLFKTHWNY